MTVKEFFRAFFWNREVFNDDEMTKKFHDDVEYAIEQCQKVCITLVGHLRTVKMYPNGQYPRWVKAFVKSNVEHSTFSIFMISAFIH